MLGGWGIALLALCACPLYAETTEPGTSPTPGAGETRITSQMVDFDLKSRQAVYRGDVRVIDPRIELTCERLTATLSESGGSLDSLVAESNVVAHIATNQTIFTVTASKAIYTYQLLPTVTNQTLELTGLPEPTITWPQEGSIPARTNEFAARRILWNIGTGNINAEGHRGVFPSVESLNNPMKELERASATNSPPTNPASHP